MHKKLLQINAFANTGSTGRITEDIAKAAMASGYESYIAYGRSNNGTSTNLIRIGNKFDVYYHGLYSRLFDRHGLASKRATKKFIRQIEKIQPDIIHIHNLHGYFINYEILFNYLNGINIPVVWTFHDCWPITGHCAHFISANCSKWQIACYSCPKMKYYPKSIFRDNSRNNYDKKKEIFSACKNLTIVTPSDWLKNIIESSFLGNKKIITINNGIDVNIFKPANPDEALRKYAIPEKKFIILGVANIWTNAKGFQDFVLLSKCIDCSCIIVLVGLNKQRQKGLPKNIIGISRTENMKELAQVYSMADIFINPTWADNFPTTNMEALACGTPVITYNTGGSPEIISDATGFVIEKGNVTGLKRAIDKVKELGKDYFPEKCRQRAIELYNKEYRYDEYLALYNSLLKS